MSEGKAKQRGKKNKAAGARFERKTRKALENLNWHVIKYQNNVDLNEKKVVNARALFGMRSTGFPDFLVYSNYEPRFLIGLECKKNGYLNPLERKKRDFLLSHNCFDCFHVICVKNFNETKRIFEMLGGVLNRKT